MREIPAEVRELLKSRSMIGPNRPACEVMVQGGNRQRIGPETVQGYNSISDSSWTNWVTTSDGRYMSAFVNRETSEVMVAYCDDTSFLSIDYAATSVAGTGIILTHVHDSQLSLYKRDDGKILLFTNEAGETVCIVKCYISSGVGFSEYSTIYSIPPIPEMFSVNSEFPQISIPIKTQSGRLMVSFGNAYNRMNFASLPGFFVYVSDDEGLTWKKNISFTPLLGYGVSPLCQLPDGSIWVEFKSQTTKVLLYYTTDDGKTWSEAPNISSNFGNDNDNFIWWSSFFYDPMSQSVYRIAPIMNGLGETAIWRLKNPTQYNFTNGSLWQKIATVSGGDAVSYIHHKVFLTDNNELVFSVQKTTSTKIIAFGKVATVPIKSISISRDKNMASSCDLIIDNKNGEWAPDGETNHNVLWPNKQVVAEQGYGAELTTTFTGLIDKVEMTTFPQEIRLSTRDNLKKALDQTITNLQGGHVILYENKTVEYIFKDLCIRCGLDTGTIQPTGLTITKEFGWESYGDAFTYLADLVGYEFVCDEDGIVHFRRDGKTPPQATNWLMTFTDGIAHTKYYPIVKDSETIKYEDTTYVKDVDYTIDYQTGTITSITIPDVTTTISFTYIAYEFTEGVDIISLGYTIDDNDLYYAVICYGQGADDKVITATAAYGSRDYYNVLPQKIMKIDAPDADTVEKCQDVANRAVELMSSRARSVRFAAVAVPWLQVGDFIKIIESSTTISEIYRITDLSTDQSKSGYIMQMTCYHHGGA